MRKIVLAEIRRTFLENILNKYQYISLFLWPLLTFLQMITNILPFDSSDLVSMNIFSGIDLVFYIFTGFVVYFFFNSLIENATRIYTDRYYGTLEAVWLTPINKILFIYGRASGGLISTAWAFIYILILTFIFFQNITFKGVIAWILIFFIICITAIVWGGFLISLCLSLRDPSIIFSILDGPDEIVCGVQVPTFRLPKWVQIIASVLPLTYSISLIRYILFGNILNHLSVVIMCIGINIMFIILTITILKFTEKSLRKTGNYNMY